MHEQPPRQDEAQALGPEAHEARRTLAPRIYVASLADYNNGRLHGTWLDAALDPEELHSGIAAMLAESREPIAEEWAIHDHDDFGGLRIDEYEGLGTVSRLAQSLVRHGHAFAGLVDHLGTAEATEETFVDSYLGCWPSVTAYAEQLAEECDVEHHLDQLPSCLRRYVRLDPEAFGRDLVLGGEVATHADPEGGVHIYLGC